MKNKYSKVLNGNVHRTSGGPNCRTSWDVGMFWGSLQDVGHTCLLNSTHKHIKLNLAGSQDFIVIVSSRKASEQYSG